MTVPVCIKIIKNTAFFQDPVPFLVCFCRVRKIPGNVSGNNNIKTVTFHIKILSIASFPHNRLCQWTGVLLCFFQHFFGIVYSSYFVSCFCEQYGKKSRAGSHIKNPDLLRVFLRKLPIQKTKELVSPHGSSGVCHFLLIIFRISSGSVSPVVINFIFQIVHSCSRFMLFYGMVPANCFVQYTPTILLFVLYKKTIPPTSLLGG